MLTPIEPGYEKTIGSQAGYNMELRHIEGPLAHLKPEKIRRGMETEELKKAFKINAKKAEIKDKTEKKSSFLIISDVF